MPTIIGISILTSRKIQFLIVLKNFSPFYLLLAIEIPCSVELSIKKFITSQHFDLNCVFRWKLKLKIVHLTLYLLVPSADNICKQFWPGSDLTKRRVLSGSKLFDTLIVFLKEFFRKKRFWKKKQSDDDTWKKHEKLPRKQRVKYVRGIIVQLSQMRLNNAVSGCFVCLLNECSICWFLMVTVARGLLFLSILNRHQRSNAQHLVEYLKQFLQEENRKSGNFMQQTMRSNVCGINSRSESSLVLSYLHFA